jgi:pyrroline-5-carboxylate reductase
MRIGIVGCGNLGLALLKGIRKNNPDAQIIASKRNIDSLLHLNDEKVEIVTDNVYLLKNSDVIILALKPYTILDFVSKYKDFFDAKQHLLISVATGIQIREIQEALGKELRFFRAMPNTGADVGESMTAICAENAQQKDHDMVKSLFDTIGESIFIDEQLMESATILGACGIAYVLRFIRAMIQGGIQVGFDAQTAKLIVSQTVKGAATLLIQNGTHPEEEIDKVTTPKGCTIVGLNEMEHSGFSSSLIKGIVTSYEKIER